MIPHRLPLTASSKRTPLAGFTLIELLTVIAIIGILAGILIPTVGAVRKQANVAASRSQFSGYINGILQFKNEYGFFPFVTGTSNSGDFDLSVTTNSQLFIETLSGRGIGSTEISADARRLNRRQLGFVSFNENEFWRDGSDTVSNVQLADRFNNRNIEVIIDTDGNGSIDNPDVQPGENSTIRTPVGIWTREDRDIGAPSVKSWE